MGTVCQGTIATGMISEGGDHATSRAPEACYCLLGGSGWVLISRGGHALPANTDHIHVVFRVFSAFGLMHQNVVGDGGGMRMLFETCEKCRQQSMQTCSEEPFSRAFQGCPTGPGGGG